MFYMMKLPRNLPALLPLLLLLLPVLSFSQPLYIPPPAIFNFGDSNSDTGGYSAAFGPILWPNGETYFGMPAGRCSDGRLIIDFIATNIGLPRYLSSYLDSLGANFNHGANFATASSPIIDQNLTLSQGGYSPFTLGIQLNNFMQFKSRSQEIRNEGGAFKDLMPEEEYFSRALYTFDIGQNDITAAYISGKSGEDVIPDMMREFSRVIKSIYQQGGRKFIIHNTGPLGCLPFILLIGQSMGEQLDPVGCGLSANKLAQLFNVKLHETVVQLKSELRDARISYVDIYSIKYLLISQAEKFGFEQPLKACLEYGDGAHNFNVFFMSGATGYVNGTEVPLPKSCEDPSKRVNWDWTHYTEAANKWILDRITDGEFSDPPYLMKMANHNEVEYSDGKYKPSSSLR